MKTNYDQSSTGTNIKLAVEYDCLLAQMEFRENFEELFSGFRQVPLWFFIDNGAIESPSYPSECYNFEELTEKDFRQATIDLLPEYQFSELAREKLEKGLTWEEYFIEELDSLGREYIARKGLPDISKATPLYSSVYITGHSLSDFATVLFKLEDKGLFNGSEENLSKVSELFENYFYDQPVYICLEIETEKGETIELREWDLLQNRYEYDKEEVFEKIKSELKDNDLPESTFEWIKENLPDYPMSC